MNFAKEKWKDNEAQGQYLDFVDCRCTKEEILLIMVAKSSWELLRGGELRSGVERLLGGYHRKAAVLRVHDEITNLVLNGRVVDFDSPSGAIPEGGHYSHSKQDPSSRRKIVFYRKVPNEGNTYGFKVRFHSNLWQNGLLFELELNAWLHEMVAPVQQPQPQPHHQQHHEQHVVSAVAIQQQQQELVNTLSETLARLHSPSPSTHMSSQEFQRRQTQLERQREFLQGFTPTIISNAQFNGSILWVLEYRNRVTHTPDLPLAEEEAIQTTLVDSLLLLCSKNTNSNTSKALFGVQFVADTVKGTIIEDDSGKRTRRLSVHIVTIGDDYEDAHFENEEHSKLISNIDVEKTLKLLYSAVAHFPRQRTLPLALPSRRSAQLRVLM